MKGLYAKEEGKYKQLSAIERGKIEAYYNEGKSISYIAKQLGRSKSTISEEIKRSKYNGKYKAHIAQKRAEKRRAGSHKHTKWREYSLLVFIENCLKQKWSPEIIAEKWKEKTGGTFSHTSIYTLIKEHRPEWIKYLVCKGKKYKKLTHSAGACKIPNRVDISERDKEIEERTRFGDFEVDTVLSSRKGKSCIAVFAERKTRMYFLQKMKDKTAEQMFLATMKALKNLPVKTMTYDNGTENVYHEQVNNLLNCKSYFCRPYCSGDKGLIENRNKILRQFLPKGTNFDLISDVEIHKIQDKINRRPMKALGWLSPVQCFNRSFGLLV